MICQVVVETGVTGRGLVTLSSILIKPLIYRDWERKLLVRQPQTTQFCLAVKRLNCTFAFSVSQLSGITGGVWCPEMRCRVLSLNQMGMIGTMRRGVKKLSAWFWVFLYKTAFFCSLYLLSLSIHLFVCLFFSPMYMCALCMLSWACCSPLGCFLCRNSRHKQCISNSAQGQHLKPLFPLQKHIGAHTIMITWSLLFICICTHRCSADARLIEPLLSSGVYDDNSGRFTTEKPSLKKKKY